MVINGRLSLAQLLEYNPKLKALNDSTILEYFDEAWWYVVKKLQLKPAILSFYFNFNAVVSIVGDSFFFNNNAKIYIKEVIDVFGIAMPSAPEDYLSVDKPTVLNKLVFPDGSYYWDGSLLYGKGIVNVLCYPYPAYDTENIPVNIGFAVIAMMHSILCRENEDIATAGMYENLAISYINIYNANIEQPKVTKFERVLFGGAYEL